MAVDRNLCGKIAPGTRVTAVGIFSVFTEGGKDKGASKAARQAIRQPYIRVVGLEEDFEGSSHYAPTFTYAPFLRFLCCSMRMIPQLQALMQLAEVMLINMAWSGWAWGLVLVARHESDPQDSLVCTAIP